MYHLRKITVVILIASVSFVLFVLSVIIVIPDRVVANVLHNVLEQRVSVGFHEEFFQKLFPLGFEARRISIFPAQSGGDDIYLDRIRVKIKPFRLFVGELFAEMEGDIGDGRITSTASYKRDIATIDFSLNKIDLAGISLLQQRGLRSRGKISGKGRILMTEGRCPEGRMNMTGDALELDGPGIGSLLSLLGDSLKLSLETETASDCIVQIKGLWVEATDISARINGSIAFKKPFLRSVASLAVEILPKRGFDKKNRWILAFLEMYKKSSNYYLMHIRGPIQQPRITK